MSEFKNDFEATKFLKSRGYLIGENFSIDFNESVLDDEFEAVKYLCEEWDYHAEKKIRGD